MKGIRGLAEAISEWAGGGDAGVPGAGSGLARAEYNARDGRLGGAIAVNLIEPAGKTGVSYGPDVVFKIPVEPGAGQVFRALVVGFRLVDAIQDPGVYELSRESEGGGPENIGHLPVRVPGRRPGSVSGR